MPRLVISRMNKYILISIFTFIGIVATHSLGAQTYDPYAVQVINNLIANNGLYATPNTPETWDHFATWNDENPKQITGLYLHPNLHGNASLSGLTTLQYLNCSNSDWEYGLNILDLTNCTQLQQLTCDWHQLVELNLTNCLRLKELNCSYNKLTELDLTKFTQLQKLYCNDNELTELDPTNCEQLQQLGCSGNKLAGLNVTKSMQLQSLNCYGNNLTELDVTKCTQIDYLICGGNNLTELDVTKCTQLKQLACNKNQITELDLAKCTQLRYLYCYNNPLVGLDLTNCTQLYWLQCNSNGLTELDLTNCKHLRTLWCYDNFLTKLDLANCTSLVELYCARNRLTELDLTGLRLTYFWGVEQSVSLILYENDAGGYTHIIYLNSPTFGNNAISYWNGILKSTNHTVSETSFFVSTNDLYGRNLEGTMNFIYSGLGINSQDNLQLKVYPNPTAGELIISNEELEIKTIEVFDIYGRKQKIIINYQLSIVNSINISHLQAGIYFVKISTKAGEAVRKVLKE